MRGENEKMSSPISKKNSFKDFQQKWRLMRKRLQFGSKCITDTLYKTFSEGRGVTLTGFGSFYLDRRNSCAFKFNPSQKLKSLLGWSSTYKG